MVDPVIDPVGEARSNFDLFQGLAKELGYDDAPFTQSAEQRLASYLATMDGVPEDFRIGPETAGVWVVSNRRRTGESVRRRFGVPFAFRTTTQPDTPEIPCLLEAVEFGDRDLQSRYPFQLITPPHQDLLNSTFGESSAPFPGEVLVHPEDGRQHGIIDGATVVLSNHRGRTRRIARLSEDTRRGLLVAEGIFWQAGGEWGGINDLTSQKTTDIGGGPTFHESLVAISVLDG